MDPKALEDKRVPVEDPHIRELLFSRSMEESCDCVELRVCLLSEVLL